LLLANDFIFKLDVLHCFALVSGTSWGYVGFLLM
jgi:hypothetical protein